MISTQKKRFLRRSQTGPSPNKVPCAIWSSGGSGPTMRLNSGAVETRSTGELLALHAEQARRVAAEDRDLVFVAQRCGREYVVDGMLLPRNRMVAADDDLARTDLRHQVTERLGREHQRVEIELIEIAARLLLELNVRVTILRRDEAGMVATRRVGAEIAAAVRGDDLQAGEAIERALEDQMLQGDRRIERIADGVREPAVALEAPQGNAELMAEKQVLGFKPAPRLE